MGYFLIFHPTIPPLYGACAVQLDHWGGLERRWPRGRRLGYHANRSGTLFFIPLLFQLLSSVAWLWVQVYYKEAILLLHPPSTNNWIHNSLLHESEWNVARYISQVCQFFTSRRQVKIIIAHKRKFNVLPYSTLTHVIKSLLHLDSLNWKSTQSLLPCWHHHWPSCTPLTTWLRWNPERLHHSPFQQWNEQNKPYHSSWKSVVAQAKTIVRMHVHTQYSVK
jgi:hypothetical protein